MDACCGEAFSGRRRGLPKGVYRRTFVLDMDQYLRVRKDESLPTYSNVENMPGSTSVQVARLSDPQFLIEIDLLAALPT
jgi:enamine deaminase RidA (YjgF/YER057c/UK114 family)